VNGQTLSATSIIAIVVVCLLLLWGATHKQLVKSIAGPDAAAYPSQQKVAAAKFLGRLQMAEVDLRETQSKIRSYLSRFENGIGTAGDSFFGEGGKGENFHADRRLWFALRVEPWELARESRALLEAATQAKHEVSANPGKIDEWAALADEIEEFCDNAHAAIKKKDLALTQFLTRFQVRGR